MVTLKILAINYLYIVNLSTGTVKSGSNNTKKVMKYLVVGTGWTLQLRRSDPYCSNGL